MSEQILLLNPRPHRRRKNRRRMPAALRRYWAQRRRSINPRRRRRRKHHARAINRRTHRRMHPRRINPRVRRSARSFRRLARRRLSAGKRYGGRILGAYVIPGAVGATGALALDVIWGYASPHLPTQLQAGWAALAAKLGVVVGAAYLVRRFRPGLTAKVNVAAVGAATVAMYGALKGVAQSILPASIPGLSGYMDYQSYALPGTRMHGYMPRAGLGDLGDFFSPAAVIQPQGTPVPRQFGGYIAAQPMAGYMQPHMMGSGGLMGYDWQNDGM